MKYDDLTFDILGTKRQRPMYLSCFTRARCNMDMKNYPKDPHEYTKYFISYVDKWIKEHKQVKYNNLDSFNRKDVILGTTHQLDELHLLYGKRIAVFKGEYKYHRRLTNSNVKQITSYKELLEGDVLVVSYPSCITTNIIKDFDETLDYCLKNNIQVHIDGAWFGQCRNFNFDVSHPAILSVSVSLSKAYGMGSQRIGIRYSRNITTGPISIMNDYGYVNVSDMWIGVEMINKFGPDYWWNNYSDLYSKVCKDFNLKESNSIHVGWHNGSQLGIRTPLRLLIEGVYDERGSDKGLNTIERTEA